MKKLYFASDYQEGMCEAILERLSETNRVPVSGYGTDEYCEEAKEKIRSACGLPEAEVYFISGGTQANKTVIAAALREYQGVISADTGHVNLHEAGAIEYTGHKVLAVPGDHGKLPANALMEYLETFYGDANREHMVQPGMVYISQPTEYGTLYTKAELTRLREICDRYELPLYADGARLAYALACEENDVTLSDLAHLSDVFYIGGTKCGAMIGEAIVIRNKALLPHFFTSIKQHGALLAKGRLLGISFGTLFTDGLYEKLGAHALKMAAQLKRALTENHWKYFFETPTNQIFVVVENDVLKQLGESVVYSFWEKYDDTHTVIRFATSWATPQEDIDALIRLIETYKPKADA